MIKKTACVLAILAIVMGIQSFTTVPASLTSELDGPVHWYTFGEAVELQKKSPRMIMVDVYTSWCGPCKMMSAHTFANPVIAKCLNENFYPVKFNAETRDTVIFNGYMFLNKNPEGVQRPVHDFALSILENKLSYPSIVYLNEELIRVQTIAGFFQPKEFEPIVKYFGSGKYKTVQYEEFTKTFVPEIK